MCNDQHLVTNHTKTKSQISQEQRAALPSPFTGGCLHMCSLKKCITHSQVTTCQLYFLVPLSSFLAQLLALSHMQMNSRKLVMWAETNTVTVSSKLHQTLFKFQCHPPWPGSCQNSWYVLTIDFTLLTSERQTETERETDCSNLKPFTVFIQIWLPLCIVLVNALGFEQLHARDLLYIRIIETCCFSAYFQVQWCNMDFKIKFTLLLNILHLWTVQTYFVSSMLSDSFSLPKSALSVKCNTKKVVHYLN